MIIFNSPNISFSSDGWKRYKLRRLYFIWVCRDVESFRWFADLLCMLHDKVTGVAWRDANNVINAGYVHTTHVAFYKEYQQTSALPRLPGLHLCLELRKPVYVTLVFHCTVLLDSFL